MWCIRVLVLVIGVHLVASVGEDSSESSEESIDIWYTFAESNPSHKKCTYYRITDDYTMFDHFMTDIKTGQEIHLKGKMQSRNGGRITDMMYTEPKAYTLEYNIVFVNDDFEISFYTADEKNHYFVYTKERNPSKEIAEQITQRLEQNNISEHILKKVDQSDCPDVL